MYVQNTLLHTCANQSESIGKGSHLYIIMTYFYVFTRYIFSMHRD